MGDNQPLRTHSSLKGADFKVAPATEAQPTPSVVVDLQAPRPRRNPFKTGILPRRRVGDRSVVGARRGESIAARRAARPTARPPETAAVAAQVQAPRTKVDEEPPVTTETFEIRPGVLDAMLEGFGKIRDQLEKV